MGDIRKKKSIASVVLLCLTMLISVVSMCLGSYFITAPINSKLNMESETMKYPWTASGIRQETYANFPDEQNKLLLLQDEGELGLFNYEIMKKEKDYSGWTVRLVRDMDMLSMVSGNDVWEPYWTPIPIGTDGKNVGIIFDGAGFTIKNLNTIINDGYSGIDGVGFFSNLVGGVVRNVTFENCIIKYSYNPDSSSDVAGLVPTEVAVGTVAGFVDGTMISNVNIANPTVSLVTNNKSGHNFYVGAAVGRLSNYWFKEDGNEALDVGTLDTVDVLGGSVKLNVSDNSLGTAMNGYLGGLAGENISGAIMNCKIKGVNIEGNLDNSKGTYFAGGIVGKTCSRQINIQPISVSSIFNNIVMSDVIVNDKTADTNVGLLTGQVFINWVHSNIYIGNSTYDLFGSLIHNDLYYSFSPECSGCYGALDPYFKKEGTFSTCAAVSFVVDGREYVYCNNKIDGHTNMDLKLPPDLFAKANYKYASVNDADLNEDFYNNLNSLDKSGAMYEISKPILKYKQGHADAYGIDIPELMVREAIKTFRIWQVDENNEPYFGDYFDLDYDLIFDANGGYWPVKGEEDDIVEEPFFIGKYKYNQVTSKPDEPLKTGYSFVGWYKDKEFRNEWNFSDSITPDKMGLVPITLYAKWEINSFSVEFMVDGNVHKKYTGIPYNTPITQPEEPKVAGMEFTGWYSDETLEHKWELGAGGEMMPGYDLVLYAGWLDIFNELRNSLRDSAAYLSDIDFYSSESFNQLVAAREIAQKKCDGEDVGMEASDIITLIKLNVAGLRVNVDRLKNHEAIMNQNSNQNKYSFLYTAESYQSYLLAKGTAISYLEAFSDIDATNVENLKSIYNLLDKKYTDLEKNPNLGADETEISNLIASTEEALASIDDSLVSENYTEDSWVEYQIALTNFRELFDSSEPYMDEMQNAITNLKVAKSGLVLQEKPTPPDPEDPVPDPDKPVTPALPISPILLGCLISGAMILIAGAIIVFDVLKRKNKKPKKEVDDDEEVYV